MIAPVSKFLPKLLPKLTVTGRDEMLRAELNCISKAKSMLVLSPDSIRWLIGFTGSAGSLVLLLVWVYYSAQIFLFGAEYSWVYANRCGSHVQNPDPGDARAVPSQSRD